MKQILIILIILLPLSAICYEYENGGVRNAALGGTGIANSTDISTASWNPALISDFDYFQLVSDYRPFMLQLDNDDLSQNYLYLSYPIKSLPGTFAISGDFFNSEEYFEGRYGLHYGAQVIPTIITNLSAGLSIYGYNTNYKEINRSKNAVDLDLGLHYKLTNNLRFGFALSNILRADMATYSSAEDRLPIKLGVGSAWDFNRLTLSGDLNWEKSDYDEALNFGIGSEYMVASNLELRLGLNNRNLTGGFGIIYFSKEWESGRRKSKKNSTTFVEIGLDYAFQLPLDSSDGEDGMINFGNDLESDFGEHFVGLRVNFGKDKKDQKRMMSFPSNYRVAFKIDTLVVEKVIVDTVYKTRIKTVTDTVEIVKTIFDVGVMQGAINKQVSELRDADMKKINKATLYLISGLEYYYSEEFYQAIDACKTAIELAPELSLPYIWLASIYYRVNDSEEASYYLSRARRIDPNNSEISKIEKLLED